MGRLSFSYAERGGGTHNFYLLKGDTESCTMSYVGVGVGEGGGGRRTVFCNFPNFVTPLSLYLMTGP